MNPPLAVRRGGLAAVHARAQRTRRLQPAPRTDGRAGGRISLWLPLTPLFWLLAPFAYLLAPLLLLAPPLWRANPYLTVFTVGRVLTSLAGTEVDVETHDARIRLRIF